MDQLRDTSFSIPRNSNAYADISPERLYHSKSRFLKKCDGKHRSFLEWKTAIFIIDPQKTKVDQNCYIDILKTSLLPECRRLYPGIDFVFMQDSAPSYQAKATQQFLRQNTPDFIAADEWTSYSPDLIFRLLHLGYPAGFGVRRPTTSVCKSTGPQ